MSKYSIKDLERLSGIKAHTIRIWEQRYNLLSPERSDTNIRSYTNEELKRLLNISILNKYGVKISRIAELSPVEIASQAASFLTQQADQEDTISKMINAMVAMDENSFKTAMVQSISSLGFDNCVWKVIYPFLDRIGVMWQTGAINPAQEHFVSNLIRQRFIVQLDSLEYYEIADAKKVLLFLHETELHELGLLFYNYILRSYGHKTFYLGQAVPLEDLKRVCEITQPDYLLTLITNRVQDSNLAYLQQLSAVFTSGTIWAFGGAIKEDGITSFNNIVIPKDPQEFTSLLSSI